MALPSHQGKAARGENVFSGGNSMEYLADLQIIWDYLCLHEAPKKADIIVGPVGIVMADALMGEITPTMANAVAQSRAYKVLLPVNKCNNIIIGVDGKTTSELIDDAIEKIRAISEGCER